MKTIGLAMSVWVAELRTNRRLSYGLMLIAVVLALDLGLRWREAVAQQQQALVKLHADFAALQAGARNEVALAESLAISKKMSQTLEQRLWSVSSEAVGQARLKDWLTGVVKFSKANQYAIVLGASKEFGKTEISPELGLAKSQAKAEDALREFRATVSFNFTPEALETMLLAVEGGESLVAVEALTVKGVERRVEMTLRVLMRVKAGNHA